MIRLRDNDNTTFTTLRKVTDREVEVGDSKQKEFYPQVKLMQWDNETNFSARLKTDITDATYKTVDNKIEWEDSTKKTKCRLYDVPTLSGCEDGGFEFEVHLNEKPETNVIVFTLQYKGLDFFYQPELTEEEKKQGHIRPENIVGSYAVYHSTKQNDYSKIGGKNYKTGKAFHIYRPWAEDSNGWRVWCDLRIIKRNNLMIITIPEDFYEKAVYPVLIDPTFGYTTAGGSNSETNENQAQGSKFSITENGTGTKLTAYVKLDSTPGAFKGVIWNDDTNKTVVTNGVGAGVSLTTSYAWTDSSFSTSPNLSTGDYWLGYVQDDDYGYVSIKYDSVTTDWRKDTSNSYSSPGQLDGSSTSSNTKISAYVTYDVDETKPNSISEELHYCKEETYTNSDLSSDNFNDNSIDTGIWTNSGSVEQNQRLEQTITSTTSQVTKNIYQGSTTDDFDVTVKLIGYTNDEYNILYFDNDYIGLDGSGYLVGVVNGSKNSVSIPSTPFWLRGYNIDGTMAVYYSTDGTSWTILKSRNADSTYNKIGLKTTNKADSYDTYTPYFNTGSDLGDRSNAWSNVSNAFDGSDSDYASVTLNLANSNTLKGTANSNTVSSGTIDKVELYTTVGCNSYAGHIYTIPVFNGSTDGDTYDDDFGESLITKYFNITGDTNAPSTWSWSDINNLDVKVYINNVFMSNIDYYIYKIGIKITANSVYGTAHTYWDDFSNNSYEKIDTTDIILYDDKVSVDGNYEMEEYFPLYVNGAKAYAEITTSGTGDNITDLHVRKSSTSYAFRDSFTGVEVSKPRIHLSESSFSNTTTSGVNPSSDTFDITNTGSAGTTLSWTISKNESWLSVSPTSGTTNDGGDSDTITVSYDVSGLSPAIYTDTITVTDSGASNSPQTISVSLTVQSATSTGPYMIIAQDTNGTFDCNVTSYTDVPFNNLIEETDDTQIEQTSTTQYTVKSAGHYLVMYNLVHRNDSYGDRVEFVSRVEVNGSDVYYGKEQGYRRDANNDRVFHSGAAILDLSANDVITVAVARTGTNDPTNHYLEANRSGIQIVQLDDSFDYFRAKSTDTTNINGSTFHAVTWDTEDEKDSSYTHSANSASVTLAAGFYLVAYTVHANTGSSTTRKTISTKATLGGTDIPQAWSYSYMRGSNGTNDGVATALFLLEVTSSSDLQVLACTQYDEGSATTSLVSGESTLSVMKLPSAAEKLIVYKDSATGCETAGVVAFNQETQEDTSSFSHSSGVVTVQKTGNYLFGANLYAWNPNYSGAPTGTRGYFGTKWRKNSTAQEYGCAGHYNRNDQSTTGSFAGGHGCWSMFVSLSSSDTIDLYRSVEGQTGGNEDDYKASQHGMWAINLDTLF